MDKKKMLITAGIMAGVGYGTYKYFKKNPDKLNMIKNKMKNAANAVNDFENKMMWVIFFLDKKNEQDRILIEEIVIWKLWLVLSV